MVDLFICLLTPSSSDNVQPRYVMLYQKSQSDATDKNWRSPRSRRPDVERRIRPERTWHRFRKSEIHSAPKRLEFRKKKKTSVALDARWTREISQENRLSVVHARSKGGDEKCTYEGSLKMAEEGFRAK